MEIINVLLLIAHSGLCTLSGVCLFFALRVNRNADKKQKEMTETVEGIKQAHNAFTTTQETTARQIQDLKTQVGLQWKNTRT